MTISIGIIAEDRSDIEVIEHLIRHYKRPRKLSFQPVALGGCAKVRTKAAAYSVNLANRGCTRLIVVHDADERSIADQTALKAQLSQAIQPGGPKFKIVVIPVKEIEAWLLADVSAIRKALGIKKQIKKIANPEGIKRPKEYLRDEIFKWTDKKTRYYNTIHNPKIAAYCDPKFLKACPSFQVLDQFVLTAC